MKKFLWINNNLPEPYIYFTIIEDNKERFLKIDFSYFPEMTYKAFESYGYKVTEIQRVKFATKKAAYEVLNSTIESLVNQSYVPLHKFPEPNNCFNTKIMNFPDIQVKQYTNEKESIEAQVIDLVQKGIKPKEIITKLGVKDYYISRVKKKFNL